MAERLDDPALARRAEAIRARLTSGAVYVAFVGQTNRGKSSLINALLAERVLPTGIVPVTAAPTHVAYGESREGIVHRRGGATEPIVPATVVDWISAEWNPGNVRGVEYVELRLPAALLASGLRLIDTPGVGSVDSSAESGARSVLAHVDAAVLVVGADPPVTADECSAFAAVAQWVSRVIVVMNKVDTVPAETLGEVRRFAASTIEDAIRRPIDRIFEVAAGADTGTSGGATDWADLLDALAALTGPDRAPMLAQSAERETVHLVRYALDVVRARSHNAYAPVAACDDRIEAIRRAEGHLAHETLLLSELVARTRREIQRRLRNAREAFCRSALAGLADELDRRASTAGHPRESRIRCIARDLAGDAAQAWAAGLPDEVRSVTDAAEAEAGRIVGRAEAAREALERVVAPAAAVAPGAARAPTAEGAAGDFDDEPPTVGPVADRPVSGAARFLPGWIRKRHLLAMARDDLARRLDSATRAAALAVLRAGMVQIDSLDASWQVRARAAHAEAEGVIREAQERREGLDPPAHRELDRLAGLRRELLAQLPSAAG